VPLSDGGADTYIDPAKYHHQFAADVDEQVSALMAATQRPIPEAALGEPSPAQDPLWKTIPSWFLFGELDLNIPGGAHHIMAERVGARRTVEIAGASHSVGVSHPDETTGIILEAAGARVEA
jgi:pimeloyl-ACP methyl ester carboxylesterase